MAVLALLAISIGLMLTALFLFYKKSYRFWRDRGFVHTNPSLPFGDAITSITKRQSFGETIDNIYSNYRDQPFVGFWLLFRPILLVRDPDLIKDILVRDFMAFHDRGIYIDEKKEPLTGALFMISGQKWKNMRVRFSPAFTSGKMKMMFPIMEECSRRMVKALEDKLAITEIVEMKEWSARLTTDIISLCAFGIEANSLNDPNAEFRRHGAQLLAPTVNNILRLLLNFLAPDLIRLFKIRAFDKEASDFFSNVVRETIDHREKNQIRRSDFLDMLIQLKNKGKFDEEGEAKSGKPISFDEAAAQAFQFFVAGYETSATTMQYALYELAKNPEIQNKLREEIDNALKNHGGVTSYDSIASMEFLGRVVNETLRLHPVVPVLQRETSKDYQIPNTKLSIPKGTGVMIDVLGLHSDPDYYPNPKKFDPDRFLDEVKNARHNYAYLPFGEGPRNCIGMRFGVLQVKMGVIAMIKNFKFSVCSETPIPLKIDHRSFIMTPESGMYLKIAKVN